MRGAMGLAVIPAILAAILLMTGGCATKDWVKNLVGQKEVEIDQRFGQQGQKVSWIEAKLGSVETTAGEARTRADAAYSRADEVNERLSRLWTSRHKRQLVETFHVQFGFDKWELTDGAQTVLLAIAKDLRANPNLTVDLEGYTDPTGAHAYNVGLSQRRVEAVRRYLVEQGAELPRVYSIGLGPLNGKSSEEHAKQRRVTVRLMVNQD